MVVDRGPSSPTGACAWLGGSLDGVGGMEPIDADYSLLVGNLDLSLGAYRGDIRHRSPDDAVGAGVVQVSRHMDDAGARALPARSA